MAPASTTKPPARPDQRVATPALDGELEHECGQSRFSPQKAA
jgi:hypothetical protein